MSISLIFISASYPFSCKDAVFLIQFNPDIMPVVSYCHKPCCAASKKRVKYNAALWTACKDAPLHQLRGIRCKMISPVRHCVDRLSFALSGMAFAFCQTISFLRYHPLFLVSFGYIIHITGLPRCQTKSVAFFLLPGLSRNHVCHSSGRWASCFSEKPQGCLSCKYRLILCVLIQ